MYKRPLSQGCDERLATLHERMKFARLELGETQKHIAELAGINLRTYINYEQGERETPVSVVVVYSSLGVNPNWLLTGEGEMTRSKSEAKEVASEAVEALSEDRMLEKIVLMLADMSKEERREVFDHVQKTKRFGELEREVEALKAERAE